MQGFDIKGVRFKAPEEAELLTGEYVKGLDPASDIQTNAEVEGEEYIQFPDGTVQEAKGEPHENGGVKMNLPDGTKVLSDNLTLTKEDVKMLKDQYDIKSSTSDTFATALEKYIKKIGLEKLYEEQEELFETLKEQLEDKTIKGGTLNVNKEYISKKIYDIEQQKNPKEKLKADMFNILFEKQEKQKKPEKAAEEAKFKYGGVSRSSFDSLCKKHGMTPEEGIKMLEDGGILVPKYQDGAETPKYTFSYTDNTYKPQERVEQSAKKDVGYGNVQTSQDALQQLYNNFPDIIKNNFANYVTVDDKGNVTFKGGINLGTKQAVVGKMQKDINDRMVATAMSVYNDETMPQEEREKAKEWLSNEQFTFDVSKSAPLEERVRAYDEKLGQFTAGRTIMAVDLVTPEDLIKLQEKGIRTFNQITPEILDTLSDESKKRYENFKPKVKQNADFFINPFNTAKPEEAPKVEEPEPEKEPVKEGEIKQQVKLTNKKYPTMFFNPDQSTLAPSPQQAETMVTQRYQRIDPIRIGIEDTLRQLSDSRQFVSEQIDTLPPTQRAAALSSILAQTQAAENEAFLKTNQTNAAYQQEAELFNIGQAEKEDTARASNLLNYEARALTGAAKTEEDFRNYFDFNRKMALNNYNTQRNLNLLNSMFPDYQLNFTGTAVDYDPSSEFQVQNRDKVIATMGMNPYTQNT